MKHRFPIPYARDPDDDRIGQLSGWLATYGWRMDGLTVEFDRLHWPAARYQVVLDGRYAGVLARIHVESGAVLVYDDEERTLGVTHRQPEPEPEDEIPAQWREPEDAVPAGFVDRNADMSLIRDDSKPTRRRRGRARGGQDLAPGATRPALLGTPMELLPPSVATHCECGRRR